MMRVHRRLRFVKFGEPDLPDGRLRQAAGVAQGGSRLYTGGVQPFRILAGLKPLTARKHYIRSLPVLILYPHSRCNCRCVMCDIWKITAAGEISLGDLERHLHDIETLGVEWVVFSGGEPLMHTDLFRLSQLLRGRGIRTTILTTGLLLERYADRIVRSVDEVIVSLDGPSHVHDRIRCVPGAFERLAKGVRALHASDEQFPVSARTTVQRLNHTDLRATVETAKALGLESISFLAADLTSTAFNRPTGWGTDKQSEVALDARQAGSLESEIEALIHDFSDDIGSGFVRERPDKLRRIVKHFRAHLGQCEAAAPRCNAPWVSAVVETDGTVRPCFFHPAIGNIQEATSQRNSAGRGLIEVLNSPAAIAFRETLNISENPICRRCVCSLDWVREE